MSTRHQTGIEALTEAKYAKQEQEGCRAKSGSETQETGQLD